MKAPDSPSGDFVNAPRTPKEPTKVRKVITSIASWIKESASGLAIPLIGKKGNQK